MNIVALASFDRRTAITRYAQVLLCAVCLALALPAAAQPRNAGNGNNQITLNLQDVDVSVLISTVSEVTGRNFVVDPRVKGKVSVISGKPLSGDQLYDVFLSILEVHNFAAIESGGVIKILPANVVKQRPTPTEFTATGLDNDAQITQVIQLGHASVQELVPIIRPLVPPTSHFAAHTASNTLIITDTAANIRRVLDIVGRIDVPDQRTGVHVVYLKHGDATELAATLTQLMANMAASGQDPTAAAGARPTIQAHPSINALVINASDTEFAMMMALIDQLDIERVVEGDVHVVYLKYAKATDLVSLLNEVITSATGGAEGGAVAENVSVQADEGTNSLVVHAKDSTFQTIEAVIEKLDVRRAQVFVEAIIAEVSDNKAADLGIEFTAERNNTPTGTSQARTDFTDITGGLQYSILDNTFGSISLDAVLRALNTDENSNILATPTILTLDNESAEIKVGQEVPFVTGSFSSTNTGTGTVVGEGGETITGVVNPFQTIERKDVGLTLNITPQINEGDTIRLEVSQEISTIAETTVQGAADLITNIRSIEATVQVDDGQLVVLGGLIQEDVQDNIEWVPILGRIPILGALFRRKSKDATKVNLLVFLKPKIMRSPIALADYSREHYRNLRESQLLGQPDTRYMIHDAKPPVLPEYEEKSEWSPVNVAPEQTTAPSDVESEQAAAAADLPPDLSPGLSQDALPDPVPEAE